MPFVALKEHEPKVKNLITFRLGYNESGSPARRPHGHQASYLHINLKLGKQRPPSHFKNIEPE